MNRGFTLIEVMIAMFIAAIMFAIGYSAIDQAMKNKDSLETSQARVTEIQRAMRFLAQDFAQIVARPSRDTQGTGELQPAVSSRNVDNTLITFSRAGWANPAGVSRPAEQRVRYRFMDGSLIRDHWLSMDPALNAEPRQRILLTKVRVAKMRFLDPVSRAWRNEWPAITTNGPITPAMVDQVLMPRPLAIEVTLELEDWGNILRIFEIPT
jgi:general secretion pathway protein J